MKFRSNHPEGFLRKYVLKICSKFIGEHPCQSVISTKLLYYVLDLHCEKIQIIWQFRISLILLWMSNYRSLQWNHNSIDLVLFCTGFSIYLSPGPATILKKLRYRCFLMNSAYILIIVVRKTILRTPLLYCPEMSKLYFRPHFSKWMFTAFLNDCILVNFGILLAHKLHWKL